MSDVEHGRGYVVVHDTGLSDEVRKNLSARATHIYRDSQGKIKEKGAVA